MVLREITINELLLRCNDYELLFARVLNRENTCCLFIIQLDQLRYVREEDWNPRYCEHLSAFYHVLLYESAASRQTCSPQRADWEAEVRASSSSSRSIDISTLRYPPDDRL